MTRLFLLVVVACAASCVGPSAAPADVRQKAIDRVTSLTTYRATLEMEMFPGGMAPLVGAPDAGPDIPPMKARTTVEAWLPDRMRSTTTVDGPGGSVRYESIYDGATVWVSAVMGEHEQHHRVDQKLAVAGHPFDVGFNMRGGGLAEGEDFRGTVLWFLNTWIPTSATPTTLADTPCTALTGTMDVERAVNDTLGNNGEQIAALFAPEHLLMREAMAEMMGRTLAEMRVGTMCVSSDGDVVGWSVGTVTSPTQRVTVTSFERNPTIPIERFLVSDAIRAVAVDVSDTVRTSRAAPPVDPNALAAFRSAVLAASAPVASPSK